MFVQLRKKLRKSQEEFAKMIGVSIRTLSAWENGASRPHLSPRQWKNLDLILTGMGLTVQDLPDDFNEEIKFSKKY